MYSEIIKAKNGTEIPLCIDGKTLDSRYNPENQTLQIIKTINLKANYFVILGTGSGLLAQKLIELKPDCRILLVEENQHDIELLKKINTVKNLLTTNQCFFTEISSLKEMLINSYLPSRYGELTVIPSQIWIQETGEKSVFIKNEIQDALKYISADFSVQSHFGKIWNHNILTNLTYLNDSLKCLKIDNTKKAAVIAAGPSLDYTINKLKSERKDYVIFSTDTAYNSLIKNNIHPDFAVSIDGQFISYEHFIKPFNETTFLMDLCSCPSAVNNLYRHKAPFLFFVSRHPLAALVQKFTHNALCEIYNGSGTVTISALDFAIKAGFKEIEIFGADFGYLNGKSYTKGTYLDHIYNKKASKILSLEKQYDTLMYRTKLIKKEKADHFYTTEILENYQNSMEEYLINNKCTFSKKNEIYQIKNTNTYKLNIKSFNFSKKDFHKFYNSLEKEQIIISLLPLISHLRMKYPNADFEELLKLARTFFVRYN